MNKLTVGSLFSGIGGLELGLEMTGGFETKWQVEIDEFAQKVLAKHWPDVTRFRDIRTVGKHNLAHVDLICGGLPCQPHSLAGKRKASADERDLWSEFYRIICELRPQWVVAENVPGLLSSEDGRFFGRILRDLAKAGYDAQWRCLRASDFGAPHQRERVFIVAYSQSVGRRTRRPEWQPGRQAIANGVSDGAMADSFGVRNSRTENALTCGQCGTSLAAGVCRWEDRAGTALEYANSTGRQERDLATVASESRLACGTTPEPVEDSTGSGQQIRACTGGTYDQSDASGWTLSQSLLGRDLDGLSRRLDRDYRWPACPGEPQHEWEPPRTITGKLLDRNRRLKVLGNAVVPQVARFVGECILASIEREEQAS